ncbi:MAG: hypothetical protein NT033_03900, partial [Candidatus Omnitrophica bacterium]|nr:hypothetical protein [Candidatus Omnitrophota bacterium]
MNELMESQINIDSKKYTVCVSKKKEVSPEAPRIAVVSYLPNEQAKNMLEVCLDAIKYFTEEEHEVWVIDNKSPDKYAQWLLERPKINVILNQTEPTTFQLKNLILLRKPNQTQTISYANGVALEIA